MKKKWIYFLSAALCFSSPAYVFGSSDDLSNITSSDVVEGIPITSGEIWDIAQSLDSSLSLEESSGTLDVAMDVSNDNIEKNIRRFFWDIVNLIKCPAVIDEYDDVSFTFLYNDNLEYVSVSSLNSETDFSTSYIGPLSANETIKSRFPTYYYSVFGAHDIFYSSTKTMYEYSKKLGTDYELPETYRNGYLWIFSNFDTSCGFKIDDSKIYVEISGNNTIESGISTWEKVSAALDSFNTLSHDNPISMPYTEISIVCTELSTDTALWELTLEKINNSWETTKNQAVGDFLIGLSQ